MNTFNTQPASALASSTASSLGQPTKRVSFEGRTSTKEAFKELSEEWDDTPFSAPSERPSPQFKSPATKKEWEQSIPESSLDLGIEPFGQYIAGPSKSILKPKSLPPQPPQAEEPQVGPVRPPHRSQPKLPSGKKSLVLTAIRSFRLEEHETQVRSYVAPFITERSNETDVHNLVQIFKRGYDTGLKTIGSSGAHLLSDAVSKTDALSKTSESLVTGMQANGQKLDQVLQTVKKCLETCSRPAGRAVISNEALLTTVKIGALSMHARKSEIFNCSAVKAGDMYDAAVTLTRQGSLPIDAAKQIISQYRP